MRRVIATALTVACVWLLPARTAQAATAEELGVAADINRIRANGGLRPLQLHPELERKAVGWAAHLAAIGALVHSTLGDGITADWLSLAENVADGPSIADGQQHLVSSPVHHANTMDPDMSHFGVGVAATGGHVYIVVEFMQLAGAPPPPRPAAQPAPKLAAPAAPKPAAPAPAPAPRPVPSTTTTTTVTAPHPLPPPLPPPPAAPEAVELATPDAGAPLPEPPAVAAVPEPPASPAALVGPHPPRPAGTATPVHADWPLAALAAAGTSSVLRRRSAAPPHTPCDRNATDGPGGPVPERASGARKGPLT